MRYLFLLSVLGLTKGEYTRREGDLNPFAGVDAGYKSTPAFVDVDNDGDIDIVIGRSDGDLMYYVNVDGVYTLQQNGDNPFHDIDVGSQSAPAFVDMDGDFDLDLVIGSWQNNLYYYENVNGVYTLRQDGNNPFNRLTVGPDSVPAFVDVDNDSDMDLVVGRGWGDLYYYENDSGVYTLRQNGDNPFDGITAGSNSKPAFVDVDGDSDMDLVIGSLAGDLIYYENDNGAYTLRQGGNNPFAGVADTALSHSAPAFVDADDDGDMDLVLGRGKYENGEFKGDLKFYYENTADAKCSTADPATYINNQCCQCN